MKTKKEILETLDIQEDGWPKWAHERPLRQMSQRELDALPEYSTTLPDSYKRPISEGGRPWKRDLNCSLLFSPKIEGEMWIYCEYIPDPQGDPKMLGIISERIEVI